MSISKKSLKNLVHFQPGVSGNPAGRKTAGAYIKEWINSFACQGLTADQVRRIARNPKEPITRRAAAERYLRTIEAPDLADFQDAVDGVSDLKVLREQGLNTEVVKKMKTKTRTIPALDGGAPTVEVEREIELHDRAGEDFDRIMDQTEGKPNQAMDITTNGKPIGTEATVTRILALLGVVPSPNALPSGK